MLGKFQNIIPTEVCSDSHAFLFLVNVFCEKIYFLNIFTADHSTYQGVQALFWLVSLECSK